MRIRVGYELIYDCPQPTPMILTLNIHYTRASDIVFPDHHDDRSARYRSPPIATVSATGARGSWLPRGGSESSTSGVVKDTGEPDPVVPSARSAPSQDLPEETLVFLLGSRYCETDRLSQTAWDLFGHSARLGAGPGDLRFRPRPHHLRLRARASHQDRSSRHSTKVGRLPRLCPSGHRVLPLHEHPGALLHRLSRRYRRPAALWTDGFRRLVRGVSRRPMAYFRSPQQHSADRPRTDRPRPRCGRCRDQQHVRSEHTASASKFIRTKFCARISRMFGACTKARTRRCAHSV